MPSSDFESDFAVALVDLADVHGKSATYHPPDTLEARSLPGIEGASLAEIESMELVEDDAAVSLTAMVSPERTEEIDSERGRKFRRVCEATISRDPSGDLGGVANPSLAGRMTIEEIEYAIETIEWQTPEATRVRLVRRGFIERTRPVYRTPEAR